MIRAIPKMDDPAEILRILGRETIEDLEKFLEEHDIDLEFLIYRHENETKIWSPST